MDQAFLLRAARLLRPATPPPLRHETLVEAVLARQAATPAAQAARRAVAPAPAPACPDALVVLLLAEAGWSAARHSGCFNRAVAARPVNTQATRLTGIFTTPL